MAQNKLSDLNNHLFAQLERLGDENIKGEEMDTEIKKAKAISSISSQIIKSASITLQAAKMVSQGDFTDDTKTQVKKNLLT